MSKILIVDDEPNIVMTLEYALKKKGFEVFIARDGDEAIELIKTIEPNLVLLDIMMPKVDGFEVLEFVKSDKQFNQTKVIFVSAKNKASDVEKGIQLGASDYLTKPFSVKKLTEKIEHILK
ncbi:response regulator transcription factor [Brumimicrobium mesophilum]|uniref:response regulator transcription factor n=1 Tax=Brumimicrobium mesophilum TaxID=392717 RepID=UPI000D1439C1|nr:response regulator [Brumimicrobium mesophilum]